MKIVCLLLIAFIFQSDKPDYTRFLSKFPSPKWDENGNYLTRHLNAKSFLDFEREYKQLTEDESFYYACNTDSSRLFYEYDLYHMEEGHLIKHVKKKYNYYAILSLNKREYDLLMHATYDDDNNRYFYLQSFNKEGKLIDEKPANKRIFESIESKAFFQVLLLTKEGFKIFAYSDNKNINRENLKTKVVVEDYAINSMGHFTFLSKDSVYLKKPIYKYSKFNKEPEPDDPIYKYWTLW